MNIYTDILKHILLHLYSSFSTRISKCFLSWNRNFMAYLILKEIFEWVFFPPEVTNVGKKFQNPSATLTVGSKSTTRSFFKLSFHDLRTTGITARKITAKCRNYSAVRHKITYQWINCQSLLGCGHEARISLPRKKECVGKWGFFFVHSVFCACFKKSNKQMISPLK